MLILTEIYPAGEDAIAGVSGEALYRAVKKRGHVDVRFVPDRGGLVDSLYRLVQPDDVVMTLGAGDIHLSGAALLARLRIEEPHAS